MEKAHILKERIRKDRLLRKIATHMQGRPQNSSHRS